MLDYEQDSYEITPPKAHQVRKKIWWPDCERGVYVDLGPAGIHIESDGTTAIYYRQGDPKPIASPGHHLAINMDIPTTQRLGGVSPTPEGLVEIHSHLAGRIVHIEPASAGHLYVLELNKVHQPSFPTLTDPLTEQYV